MRQVIGMKPSKDPKADELRNKNLSAPAGENEQTPPKPNPSMGTLMKDISTE